MALLKLTLPLQWGHLMTFDRITPSIPPIDEERFTFATTAIMLCPHHHSSLSFPLRANHVRRVMRSKFTRAIVIFNSGRTKYLASLMPELISRISHGLRSSVLEGCEEQKGQYDDGDGPTDIPRKGYGFVISEKNEGEFVML
jgi:hypothetical protein